MARVYRDRKGYSRFSDSNRLCHRWAAEKKVGGRIWPGRVVHHKDGDKDNFRRENLQVMSNSSHSRLHYRKRKNDIY